MTQSITVRTAVLRVVWNHLPSYKNYQNYEVNQMIKAHAHHLNDLEF